MSKTIEELRSAAQVIKNETGEGRNTANRVGGLFEDIVDYIDEETGGGSRPTPSEDNAVLYEPQNASDYEKVAALNNLHGKTYTASRKTGLGKVYLQKNNGILTQEMVGTANTCYVIMYDYDLDGENLQMPANCILEFEGGSIKGGIVFSNSTKILGVPKMEKYFGAFKDSNDSWLNHDLKPYDFVAKYDRGMTLGDLWNARNTHSLTSQSIITYLSPTSAKEYIILFYSDVTESRKITAIVMDKKYNVLGKTETGYSGHANGVTIKDGNLYLANIESNNAVCDVEDLIANAIAGTSTTLTADDEYLERANSVSHDDVNGTDAVIARVNSDYFLTVFSGNDTIKENIPLRNIYASAGITVHAQQDCCIKNGIVYSVIYTTTTAYIVAVDCMSENVVFYSVLSYYDGYGTEMEGICYDAEEKVFYLSASNWSDNFRATEIYKASFNGNNFNATSDFVTSGIGESVTLNVSADSPFKTISQAVLFANRLMVDKKYGHTTIKLDHNATHYIYRPLTVNADVKIETDSTASPKVPAELVGTIYIKHSRSKLTSIHFVPTPYYTSLECYDSDVEIANCVFGNEIEGTVEEGIDTNHSAIYSENSKVRISNTVVNKYDTAVSAQAGSGFIIKGLSVNLVNDVFNIASDSKVEVVANSNFKVSQVAEFNHDNYPDFYTYSNDATSDLFNELINGCETFGYWQMRLHIHHTNSTADSITGFGLTYNRGIYMFGDSPGYLHCTVYDQMAEFIVRSSSIGALNSAASSVKDMFYNKCQGGPIKLAGLEGAYVGYRSNEFYICDANGFSNYDNKSGLLASRPTTMSSLDVGATYFATDESKMTYWTGSEWVYADGTEVEAE